ncbi:ribonucleoprotein PTB-binding 2 isoform 2-T2 [Discoglossus pictus]
MAAQDTGLPLSTLEQCASQPWASDTGDQQPKAPGVLPSLGPEEVARRLQETRLELGNRRKILIRNLPQDCSSQDIHDLLKDYEIKYCYVDKNKKTAFITLLNGDQAQDAIQKFHQYIFREKEISVQLQPTDAVLCITNLPPFFTLQEFEELLRVYGNIERCFLVYSEFTGNSKGYGFVEYMKKDSASRARLELLGKPLEDYTLFAQWMDINQLTEELIHSKCLCVDKLPKDYTDSEELMKLFSSLHTPVFCQLAEDEGNCSGGFAVIEYETSEQAEEVRNAMDCTTVIGNQIQVSFCAPGSPGRSTLAALIAAQGMLQNNRKGLLPEPNPVQIMQSLNNPAMLQMLLQPHHRGRGGKHGASGHPHFVNPTVSQALLQLNKLHQKPGLGGNVLLQNFSPLQMAQQQLLQLKSSQSNNCKPGLLGEAPVSMLQSAMGAAQQGSVEGSQREVQKNMMPYYHSQHMGATGLRLSQDKQSAGESSGSQSYLQQSGSMLGGQNHSQSQSNNSEASIGNNQTSLLGEPPRDFRLSTNPYLNLASVLPGTSMAGIGTRTLQYGAMDGSASQETTTADSYFNYSQPYEDYSQESLQQWYDQYSSYNTQAADAESQSDNSQKLQASDPQFQAGIERDDYYYQSSGYGDYNAYVQAPPTYYASAQGSYNTTSSASADKAQTSEKRAYLMASPGSSHAGYSDQYSQGSAESYTDSCFKRKKVY